MPTWLSNATILKKDKDVLNSDVLVDLLRKIREVIIGSWMQNKDWSIYIRDVNHLISSVHTLTNNMH